MRVILLQDIKSLGKRGDVKNVTDGYARNFLLPRNLVKPATPAAEKELESERAKLEKQLQELKTELENIENATAGEPLTFQVRVGEKGEVFGAVGVREIQEKLVEKFPKLQSVDLRVKADHIREVGRREIAVMAGLHALPVGRQAARQGVEGKITIEVSPSTNKTA